MRGRIIIYTILIFIFVTVQVTFLNFTDVFGVKPNLIIILIVSVALLEGRNHGGTVGFFAGICMDSVVGIALGYQALLGMLLGILLGNINKRFFKENIFVMVTCTFISTIIFESAVIMLSYGLGLRINYIDTLRATILTEAAVNSILGAVIFFILIRINRKLVGMDAKNRY